MTKPFKVPFSKKAGGYGDWAYAAGSMKGYEYVGHPPYEDTSETEWRDPVPFKATLTVFSSGRGRSAVEFRLKDADDRQYIMRLKEFTNLIQTATVTNGVVTGRWGFRKQGENFGLTYLGWSDD